MHNTSYLERKDTQRYIFFFKCYQHILTIVIVALCIMELAETYETIDKGKTVYFI